MGVVQGRTQEGAGVPLWTFEVRPAGEATLLRNAGLGLCPRLFDSSQFCRLDSSVSISPTPFIPLSLTNAPFC